MASASDVTRPTDRKDFKIAVICALQKEADAVEALFDRYWDEDGDQYGKADGDPNAYTTGVIGRHNVVLAWMPGMGTRRSADVAASCRSSFRGIELALVVGICGGLPIIPGHGEILLGDVIISTGAVQYTFGKQLDNKFIRKDTLNDKLGIPNTNIRAFLERLGGIRGHKRLSVNTLEYLRSLCGKEDFETYRYPGAVEDKLYEKTHRHKHYNLSSCTECASCGMTDDVCALALESSCSELKCGEEYVERQRLVKILKAEAAGQEAKPVIHFGLMGTGDTVMKSGTHRDLIAFAAKDKLIGFEMEGAGVWDIFPCVIIKGVCDYADSHKNDQWQKYAAAAAAACMKAFLKDWVPDQKQAFDGGVKAPPKVQIQLHCYIPFGRNKNFVGRESELEDVIARSDPRNNKDDCQRVAITGLGGVGKTQLVLEAAFRIQEKPPGCSVFWVPAINTASFEGAYRNIGKELRIAGIDDEETDVKLLVQKVLSQASAGSWLMIIDNADDTGMLYGGRRAKGVSQRETRPRLSDYLPFSREGSILLTTRNFVVASKHAGTDIVILGEMSDWDAQQLLKRSLIRPVEDDEEEDMTTLLDLLANLPLAIKQAAAFMNENKKSVSTYLNTYISTDTDFIRQLDEDFEDQSRYKGTEDVQNQNPIASTWLISFRQIEQSNELAKRYLYFMFCVAVQDIPLSLLPPAADRDRENAISLLEQYAFITPHQRTNPHRSYDIHRLVHLAGRNWLKLQGDEALYGEAKASLCRIDDVFPTYEHKERALCMRYLPHAECVLRNVLPGDAEESQRSLLLKVGACLLQTGQYQEAEDRFKRRLELTEKALGTDHIETLMCINALAETRRRLGKYEEAEEMQREALKYKEKFGADHPYTLLTMNNLGITLNGQNKCTEAEELQRTALELTKEAFGPEHPDTLVSMSNLGQTLSKQGKSREAEKIQRETLRLQKKVLGSDDPRTLSTMSDLGITLSDLNDDVGAEPIQQRTLEAREKILGEDHPDTFKSIINLAEVYRRLRKYTEAEQILQRALKLTEKRFDADHPTTLSIARNLALLLQQQGKDTEAKQISKPNNKRKSPLSLKSLAAEAYNVALICIRPSAMEAATVMLDESHDAIPLPLGHSNEYILGRIGDHNVAIVGPARGDQGKVAIGNVVGSIHSIFPDMKLGLLVGIGEGIPNPPKKDVRLGDVVVGAPEDGLIVVQYDLGKDTNAGFKVKRILPPPPSQLLRVMNVLEDKCMRQEAESEDFFTVHLQRFARSRRMAEKYSRPKNPDRLFLTKYPHPKDTDCGEHGEQHERKRKARAPGDKIRIHYSTILSGDRVMKSEISREALSKQFPDALCFEMEAAGLTDIFRHLVIRGICGYSNTHQTENWQDYAAATAAAYARQLLLVMDERDVKNIGQNTSYTRTAEGNSRIGAGTTNQVTYVNNNSGIQSGSNYGTINISFGGKGER